MYKEELNEKLIKDEQKKQEIEAVNKHLTIERFQESIKDSN